MANNSGKRSARRLTNMSTDEPLPYYPPPLDECEELEIFPLVLDADQQIEGRAHLYRNHVVEFAFTLQVRDSSSMEWIDVARVDCAHSHVHIHRMHKSGSKDTVNTLVVIETDGTDETAWDCVNRGYDEGIDAVTLGASALIHQWETS